MIIHLSIHTSKPGKERDLVDSMHRFAAAGAGQPGFIDAKTLRDKRSGRLVGMARWEDEASWRAGGGHARRRRERPVRRVGGRRDRELPARGSLTCRKGIH
jgi:heme-degrading monooxygenase HmoA